MRSDQLHRELVTFDVEHPPPATAAGRVGERGVERPDVERRGIPDLDGPGEAQRLEVGARHRHPDGVEVDPGGDQPGTREGDQVAADSAAEIDDAAPGDGRGQSCGAVVGDPATGKMVRAKNLVGPPPSGFEEAGQGVGEVEQPGRVNVLPGLA